MISCAAAGAESSAGHALDYRLVRYLDGEARSLYLSPGLKGLRLRYRPRHTVEDIAVLAVGLGEPLLDDADYDVVGYEPAAFDYSFAFRPTGVPFFGGPQDVAGGYGGYAQFC